MSSKYNTILQTGRMFPVRIHYHESPVTKVKITPDNAFLLSSGRDKRVNLYNLFTGEHLGDYVTDQAVLTFEITEDQEHVFVLGFIGTVSVFKFTGELIGKFVVPMKIFDSDLTYGGKQLILAGDTFPKGGTNCIFKFKVDEIIKSLSISYDITEANAVAKHKWVGPTLRRMKNGYLNKEVICGLEDGTLHILSETLAPIRVIELFQNTPINSITISKKFEFITCTSHSGTKMLNLNTKEVVTDYRADHPMNCAQLSPIIYDQEKPMYHLIMGGGVDAGRTADTKEGGLEIEIIHAIHGTKLATLSGHFGPVNWIECFPDGAGVVTAGEEGIVRIYRFDKSYYEDPKFE